MVVCMNHDQERTRVETEQKVHIKVVLPSVPDLPCTNSLVLVQIHTGNHILGRLLVHHAISYQVNDALVHSEYQLVYYTYPYALSMYSHAYDTNANCKQSSIVLGAVVIVTSSQYAYHRVIVPVCTES